MSMLREASVNIESLLAKSHSHQDGHYGDRTLRPHYLRSPVL